MALPMLLYGCENWTSLKWHDRTEIVEMNVFRSLAGYTLYEQKTNEVIREELNIYNWNEIIGNYKCKWTHHLLRMNNTHILKVVYEDHQPKHMLTKEKMDRPTSLENDWKAYKPALPVDAAVLLLLLLLLLLQ